MQLTGWSATNAAAAAAAVARYTLLSLIHIVFDEAFPLWAVIAVDKKGLGMDTTQIGLIMTFMGVGLLLFQVFIFPCVM